MKRFICLTACTTLMFAVSGCANGPFANGPVRTWLRGAVCNTCNPAAGQPANCGTNIAPNCPTGVCGGSENQLGLPGTGVPFYGDPNLNATGFGPTTQNYPSNDFYGSGTTGNPVNPPDVGPANQ